LKVFHRIFISSVLFASAICVSAQSPDAANWALYAPVDYDVQPNITYATANNTELKLDLYLPRDRSKPKPTLVLFHGGGWVDGAKERNTMYLLPYLTMGWVVVNVEYRIARNSLAPAAVEDCRCSLRWLTYRAKEYNIDTSKIVLTGTSAGGHLSLIAGMLPNGSVFDRQCKTEGEGRWNSADEPDVNVVTDVADLLEGPNAKHWAIEWFGSKPDRIEVAKQVSPISHVRARGPAVITIHGENDDVVPYSQAVRLHAELDKAKVTNKLITLKGRKHGGFSREEMAASYLAIREFLKEVKVIVP
jgi:acetyl esterase/lipase